MGSEPFEHESLLTLNLDDTGAVSSRMPGFVPGTFVVEGSRTR